MTAVDDQESGSSQPRKRWLLRIGWLLAGLTITGCLVLIGILVYFSLGLPSIETLSDYHPAQVSRMFDRKGRLVAELFEQKRTVVPMDRIPKHVRYAFLAAEDADFYNHPGMDVPGLIRAFWANLMAGRVVQGGSTITQQVIETFVLGPERSYSLKIRELLLAFKLESNLSKDDILFLYLNQIYFGHGCYGIQEASRTFFAKDVPDLTLAEGAVLAALPKSPAGYSPRRHPDRALHRRNWVLDQMAAKGFVDAEAAGQAKSSSLDVAPKAPGYDELAPYYAEYCRRRLEDHLGRERLTTGGLRIDLAVDLDLQRLAQKAVATGLRSVDRRQGYRGPLGHVSPESVSGLRSKHEARLTPGTVWSLIPVKVAGSRAEAGPDELRVSFVKAESGARLLVPVTGLIGNGKDAVARVDLGSTTIDLDLPSARWARSFSPVVQTRSPSQIGEVLSVGDIVEIELGESGPTGFKARLSQPPLVQGALVSLDPENGHVLAMIGGGDFRTSPLIRATQSRRQPGSAFKPVVYAAAIHSGAFTPASIMMDSPEVYRARAGGRAWKPQNFERTFLGPVSLRFALAHSINTIAVKLAGDVGIEAVLDMARALGIQSKLNRNLSLALGTSEVTPLELTNAYATIASNGKFHEPVFITSVRGPDDAEVIWNPVTSDSGDGPLPDDHGLSPAEAYVVTSMLQSVIEEGTGQRARSLGWPLAGKTGTASQQRDAWFVGFSPVLVAGVWVGFDDHARMGTGWAQGAGTALPIWIEFMGGAHKDNPPAEFKTPAGVVFARIDPENGLLAPAGSTQARFEVFVEGSEPRGVSGRSYLHSGSEERDSENGEPELQRLPEGLFR